MLMFSLVEGTSFLCCHQSRHLTSEDTHGHYEFFSLPTRIEKLCIDARDENCFCFVLSIPFVLLQISSDLRLSKGNKESWSLSRKECQRQLLGHKLSLHYSERVISLTPLAACCTFRTLLHHLQIFCVGDPKVRTSQIQTRLESD